MISYQLQHFNLQAAASHTLVKAGSASAFRWSPGEDSTDTSIKSKRLFTAGCLLLRRYHSVRDLCPLQQNLHTLQPLSNQHNAAESAVNMSAGEVHNKRPNQRRPTLRLFLTYDLKRARSFILWSVVFTGEHRKDWKMTKLNTRGGQSIK